MQMAMGELFSMIACYNLEVFVLDLIHPPNAYLRGKPMAWPHIGLTDRVRRPAAEGLSSAPEAQQNTQLGQRHCCLDLSSTGHHASTPTGLSWKPASLQAGLLGMASLHDCRIT